ncbi:hypothetical protein E3Q23_01019 [Wallemia mellicola]|uniref:Heparinase II/III family protein n=1 Tax=Wallemia mellicola TaxID=1708541 RepID=A0A4T0TST2_9BASI|nr:hypothetical protein E3Q23_01019 [Wallemia mellicola]TIC29737.1 hypothetical protein E3Q11_01297 [Wallemia mellicola]TIC68200.1 hypothetical protein E3Q01_01014 [Wallemia mellicola]
MSAPYYESAHQTSQTGLNAPYRDEPGFEMNNSQPYGSGDGFKYANAGSQQFTNNYRPWYKKKRFLVSSVFYTAVFYLSLERSTNDEKSARYSSCYSSYYYRNARNAAPPSASDAASAKLSAGRYTNQLADGTFSDQVPIYGTGTDTKLYAPPTVLTDQDDKLNLPACNENPPSVSGDGIPVTTDRPRIGGVPGRWDCLHDYVNADSYMKSWNETIFQQADHFLNTPAPAWIPDGGLTGSGVLDQAREVQQAVKAFAYAFRITNNEEYKNAVWDRLKVVAGEKPTEAGHDDASRTYGSGTSGDNNNWNPDHFLDTAEFMNSYAIAYDWLYDTWSQKEKDWIRETVIKYGLEKSKASNNYWWRNEQGNWNCVCNGAMINTALALSGDDHSGIVEQILNEALDNARQNCVNGAREDGTWTETSDYWYFGTTGWSLATASLISSTGNSQGMLDSNPNFYKTADFHIYNYGNTFKFNYGDHGPNKFTATANALMLLGREVNKPEYQLYQRDREDAADVFNMLWYNPRVAGAWWNKIPLDRYFPAQASQWASFRSSWTDHNGLFAAIKAGNTEGHQTHGDLDVGDFVIDALGQRWAGELGSANYLGDKYFNSEDQDSNRWKWYRKATEGQNVLLMNNQNAVASVDSTVKFDTTNTTQGATLDIDLDDESTGYFTADLTKTYDNNSVKRGLRLFNKRRQVLLQDDINTSANFQWRMQTNATITLNGASADLELGGEKMTVRIVHSEEADLKFGQEKAEHDPTPNPDLPNNGQGEDADIENIGPNGQTNVLTIDLTPGQYSLQVSFEPQWDGMSSDDFQTPKDIPIDDWSLTSHNE